MRSASRAFLAAAAALRGASLPNLDKLRSVERAVPTSVYFAGKPKKPRRGRSKYQPHFGAKQRARVLRQVVSA
jgi:hypothetical protein